MSTEIEYNVPDLVSFSELTLAPLCNVTEEVVKHTGQAGSIFPHRSNALRDLEIAKDNVKATLGRIEMNTHARGTIPHPDKDIKITGASMTAYVNSHEDVILARKSRAEAEYHYDNVKAVVTAYLGKRALLELMMSDRNNEYHGTPTYKAKDAKVETETGLTNFDQK